MVETGFISKTTSNKRNSQIQNTNELNSASNHSKLTTLPRDILNDFDQNTNNHMNKLFANRNSHIVWMEKLRAFFEATAEINRFEDDTQNDSENNSEDGYETPVSVFKPVK